MFDILILSTILTWASDKLFLMLFGIFFVNFVVKFCHCVFFTTEITKVLHGVHKGLFCLDVKVDSRGWRLLCFVSKDFAVSIWNRVKQSCVLCVFSLWTWWLNFSLLCFFTTEFTKVLHRVHRGFFCSDVKFDSWSFRLLCFVPRKSS